MGLQHVMSGLLLGEPPGARRESPAAPRAACRLARFEAHSMFRRDQLGNPCSSALGWSARRKRFHLPSRRQRTWRS